MKFSHLRTEPFCTHFQFSIMKLLLIGAWKWSDIVPRGIYAEQFVAIDGREKKLLFDFI